MGTFVLEITNGCNWGKCPHCYMSATNKNIEFIKTDTVEKLLRKLNSSTTRPTHILITGGEPLLHPKLVEIIKLVKNSDFITILVTNGELIDEKFVKRVKNSLDQIEVTFRGYRNLHDIMMQPHDSELWEKVPKQVGLHEQLEWTLQYYKEDTHYQKTLKAIEFVHKYGNDIKIGLNIDAQINSDMNKIVDEICQLSIPIDYINIQIQQITGRAKLYPNVPANLWRHLDKKALEKYLELADDLTSQGTIKQINIIDTIEESIRSQLPKDLLRKYYKLEISPAMNYVGNIRNNVLFA